MGLDLVSFVYSRLTPATPSVTHPAGSGSYTVTFPGLEGKAFFDESIALVSLNQSSPGEISRTSSGGNRRWPPLLASDHPHRVARLERLAARLGLGALRPAVELAAGEDHLVDLVGAVGQAQHAAEAPEGGEGGVVGHAE